jgi:hypothetical protein
MICILLSGCSKPSKAEYNSKYMIAVIETTEQDNQSIINYYDNDLNIVNSQELPYGTMGNLFYTPIIYDNNMYTIPQGLGYKKDSGIVIGMDLDSGKIKEYKIGKIAMNSLAVNVNYIFTCNTLNGISSINEYDKNSGKVTSVDINEVYISKIFINNEILYAFGQIKGDNGKLASYLYTFDDSLNILNKKDISTHGSGQYKVTLVGKQLYFTNSTDSEDKPSDILSLLSLDKGDISDITLSEINPLEIIEYKNKIFVSHCNLTQVSGKKLTILDRSNNTQKIVEFNHDLLQMQVKNDKLYVIDQENLYVYKIENDQFIPEKQVKIKTTGNKKELYYVSGFFMK